MDGNAECKTWPLTIPLVGRLSPCQTAVEGRLIGPTGDQRSSRVFNKAVFWTAKKTNHPC